MELSDQAFGKITNILAPYLQRSMNIIGNPMPEIKGILEGLESAAYSQGSRDRLMDMSAHEAKTNDN